MKVIFLFFLWIVNITISFSQEWVMGPFLKTKVNPVIKADSAFTFFCPVKKEVVKWQRADVFNPAAIVKDNKVYLLARCEDNPKVGIGGRTSRIGLAVSNDGIHFDFFDKPVLYPDTGEFLKYDYPGGCEDPRIVETEDGRYVLAYTSWNGKIARLSIALSNDLFHWNKKGPAFEKAYQGKFLDTWSKSASMVTKVVNNKVVLAKIKGKYWMYWGEHFINLAWSENLYDWFPLLDQEGALKKLVTPRQGKFDSSLTECGSPALITEKGILLFYNGRNSTNDISDPSLPKGTYSVGQLLFSAEDPEKLIARTDTCIMKPTLPHEKTGQYASGTTFSEGLVFFNGKWFLYYGTADSFVGLAVKMH